MLCIGGLRYNVGLQFALNSLVTKLLDCWQTDICNVPTINKCIGS